MYIILLFIYCLASGMLAFFDLGQLSELKWVIFDRFSHVLRIKY